MKLSQFSTLTFDCYGTLIDWETGIYQALQPLFDRSGRTFNQTAAMQAFRRAESPVQQRQPNLRYDTLLAAVHQEIADQLDVSADASMHQDFAQSIADWPPFPDTVPALLYLKQYYQLVILSNVHNAGFAQSNRLLEVEFDLICTAEDIGSYKPSHTNFHVLLSKLAEQGIAKRDILHTAQSLYHDMVPATELGFNTCWIDRHAGQTESSATPPVNQEVSVDWRFTSLAEMVSAHQSEL